MRTSLLDFQKELLRDALSDAFMRRYAVPAVVEPEKIDEETAAAVANLETQLFFRFLRHPQVYDLLVAAVRCRFMVLAQMQDATPKGFKNAPAPDDLSALVDKARICCLQVLDNHFGGVDASSFPLFWSHVLLAFSLSSSFLPAKQLKVFLTSINWEHIRASVKNSLRLAMDQLQSHFLPEDPTFHAILRDYRKRIRAYHENGFIYLLGEYRFNSFYIPPTLIPARSAARRYFLAEEDAAPWTAIFSQGRIVYVIGAPGSGKSLFCKNMIINYDQLEFPDSREYLMIYCDMKTYYTNGGSNHKSIPDFLRESIINTTGMDGGEISLDFIRYYLRMGRCLVLMDALDEVPKETRLTLHKKVVSYFSSANASNKVCITSRARGFLPQNQIEVFSIAPLTRQNISDYIDRMTALGKFKPADKEPFLQHSKPLIENKFLTSFLVLSLLVNIYKAERELPENKLELYKKCFEYIAKKRENEKSRSNYDWPKLLALLKDSTFISLATLAAPNNANIPRARIEALLLDQYRFKYADEATAEQAVRDFLEFCGDRTELLVPAAEEDTFRFFHRSFFEYFYARHILQQDSVEEMYRLMGQFDPDSEVFELAVALVKEENEKKYQDLLLYSFRCAEAGLQAGHLTAFHILTLAMQVVDDAAFIRRYFALVLDSPVLTGSKSEDILNHELIAAWLRKAMAAAPETREQFLRAYTLPCQMYLLKQLSLFFGTSKNRKDVLPSRFSTEITQYAVDLSASSFPGKSTGTLMAQISFLSDRLPFYLLAHPAPKELLTELQGLDQEQRRQFLAVVSPGRRKQLRRGFTRLDTFPPEKMDFLWDSIFPGSLTASC